MTVDIAILIGDCHLPYHDAEAVKLAFKVARLVQPKWLGQVGDMLDGYHLSRFDHDPNRKNATLAVEAAYGREFITKMRDRAEHIFVNEGNHEERLRRKLAQVPELHSTHPTMRELLELDPLEWIPYREIYTIGKLKVTHDLGPCGVNAIRQTLESAGHNIAFGHTHTGGVLYDGTVSGDRHVALNVGWLGNGSRADYATPRQRARWQHGLGFVEVERSTGNVSCHFLPFLGGTCNVPGVGRVSL